ncbi:MAG: acyltransferase domain-containing protein [Sporocytophaga sp.]|nr:acyltransferase domain-containing protein [Sporocytophaga sp.]
MKIVFLFSGQGSHYRGMGQSLFEHNTVFRNSLMQSECIVQKLLSRSLIDELYSGRQEVFDDLLMTHPAIVAVEIAMFQVLQDIGIQADYVSGNSLGEFAAGAVNGVWSVETALESAIEQAKSFTREAIPGGMIAILHHDRKKLESLYDEFGLFLAADNFEGHFTLSGPLQELSSFQTELKKRAIDFIRLPVQYPFHSPLTKGCGMEFIYYMENLQLSRPRPGFVSGLMGEEISSLSATYFWEVVSNYTNFPEVVKLLEKKGPCLYIDLGPSGTSATFVKYNLSKTSASHTFQIMTPFRMELQKLKDLELLMEKVSRS